MNPDGKAIRFMKRRVLARRVWHILGDARQASRAKSAINIENTGIKIEKRRIMKHYLTKTAVNSNAAVPSKKGTHWRSPIFSLSCVPVHCTYHR